MPVVDAPLETACKRRQQSKLESAARGWWPWQSRMSAILLIVVVGLAAYANSFSAAFVFDGATMLRDLPALRDLGLAIRSSMRPVAMVSFYANYQVHGKAVFGYHVVNLTIHLAAAAVLMEIVRRTLLRAGMAEAFRARALPLALSVALIWMVHPLQTQSVTYIYQRYESLMGLVVLLSVYGFVRALDAVRPRWWYAASIGFWLLGLGSKETAIVVPAIVLWVRSRDGVLVVARTARTTLGVFRDARRRRRLRHSGDMGPANVVRGRRDPRLPSRDAVGVCPIAARRGAPLPSTGVLPAGTMRRLRLAGGHDGNGNPRAACADARSVRADGVVCVPAPGVGILGRLVLPDARTYLEFRSHYRPGVRASYVLAFGGRGRGGGVGFVRAAAANAAISGDVGGGSAVGFA